MHSINVDDVNLRQLVTPRMKFGILLYYSGWLLHFTTCIGIIGAGSANSIVASVHGVDDIGTAALHIAFGITN